MLTSNSHTYDTIALMKEEYIFQGNKMEIYVYECIVILFGWLMSMQKRRKCMNRVSARFFGNKAIISTQRVYEIWHALGLIMKNKYGDWTLTNAGIEIGGRMSKSSYLSVPTFEYDVIKPLVDKYIETNRK